MKNTTLLDSENVKVWKANNPWHPEMICADVLNIGFMTFKNIDEAITEVYMCGFKDEARLLNDTKEATK